MGAMLSLRDIVFVMLGLRNSCSLLFWHCLESILPRAGTKAWFGSLVTSAVKEAQASRWPSQSEHSLSTDALFCRQTFCATSG